MTAWVPWGLMVAGLLVAAWQFRAAVLELGGLLGLAARLRECRNEARQVYESWSRERKAWKAQRAAVRAEVAQLKQDHQQALDLVAAYAKVPLTPDRIRRVQELLASDFGELDAGGPGSSSAPG